MLLQERASPATPSRSPTPAIVLALALLGALVAGGWWTIRQLNEVPSTVYATPDTPYRPAATSISTSPRPAAHHGEGPGWETLSTPQKLALYPLAERWAAMSEVQKRRWLALAGSFHQLPESEQARLHDRMTAWASLSAQQRIQARINFAAPQRLHVDDKRSQWDAYQALSNEEKMRLAAKAAAKPHGAATSIQPAAPKKLTHVPAATKAPGNLANPPKIAPASGATARIAAPGGVADKPHTDAPPAPAPAPAASESSPAASDAANAPAPAPAPSENIYIN